MHDVALPELVLVRVFVQQELVCTLQLVSGDGCEPGSNLGEANRRLRECRNVVAVVRVLVIRSALRLDLSARHTDLPMRAPSLPVNKRLYELLAMEESRVRDFGPHSMFEVRYGWGLRSLPGPSCVMLRADPRPFRVGGWGQRTRAVSLLRSRSQRDRVHLLQRSRATRLRPPIVRRGSDVFGRYRGDASLLGI